MAKKYNQGVSVSSARFTKAPMGELEFSRFYDEPSHTTTFNAGDIVPIFCEEVLPHDTYSIDVDEIVRQATLKVPSMDRAIIDVFAYEVPNRVVNKSWKNVMGENTSSAWVAPKVSLAPLLDESLRPSSRYCRIPVGSVADYYGFPTQTGVHGGIPVGNLAACHDLKFRGYLEIYNNYFRDQNYQPPIPYSKLNVYNGFLDDNATLPEGAQESFLNAVPYSVGEGGGSTLVGLNAETRADGSVGAGAIEKALLDTASANFNSPFNVSPRYLGAPSFLGYDRWTAAKAPLKANKLHDYFTSVLPSPQKGEQVIVGVGETAPVVLDTTSEPTLFSSSIPLRVKSMRAGSQNGFLTYTFNNQASSDADIADVNMGSGTYDNNAVTANGGNGILGLNIAATADLSQATGISISDLRTSIAVQQVYEILGRGGSRYTEYINSFFELDIDNPFNDIPTCLGHIRRNLDLFQTAQTSASTDTSSQGDLAAFGYTSTGGKLFTRTFLEHGYIHIFAVVRHKNIYPAMLSRDNFRLNMMDFYQYPLANISEQPVYAREINAFAAPGQVFGYQEAWAEYRLTPDRVSGYIRPGIEQSLDFWSYADDFDPTIDYADGEFMQSNSQEVIARGTAFLDENIPQFKAKFTFKITRERPMPTYSMAGLDLV